MSSMIINDYAAGASRFLKADANVITYFNLVISFGSNKSVVIVGSNCLTLQKVGLCFCIVSCLV